MSRPYILLVEDNPDDEALTLRAFSKNKIENDIVVTRDGAQALDFLLKKGDFTNRQQVENPQVIFLDLKLPKISGLEVLKQIRTEPSTRLIPVVVFTSSKEDEDILQSYKNGANSFVRKPIEFSEFSNAVKELGLYWVLLNQADHRWPKDRPAPTLSV